MKQNIFRQISEGYTMWPRGYMVTRCHLAEIFHANKRGLSTFLDFSHALESGKKSTVPSPFAGYECAKCFSEK